MGLLSELRYSSGLVKFLSAVLALVVLYGLTVLSISLFLLRGILIPPRLSSDLAVMLGHPSVLRFAVPEGGSREGWFFPGHSGAPAIVLCHGYESQRGDLLTLVTALQEHQFNVFVFDFRGHGTNPGWTTFGYREVGELRAAFDLLVQRNDIDTKRFGIWGANLGGYAALSVAAENPRIRAIAVESVYDAPVEMLQYEVARSGLSAVPLVSRLGGWEFLLLNYRYRRAPPLEDRVSRLGDASKLFILSRGNSWLAGFTFQLFLRAPEPREQAEMPTWSYAEMTDEEKRSYENTLVTFFMNAIPPTRPSAR